MLELIYMYVDQIYSKIRRQSINFSNKFTVSYNEEQLKIHKKKDSLPEHFWGRKVSNISLIIGKNGIGKSSLLDLISFGVKNRRKLLPRVQFFQIFHVENQIFYFDGSEALKKKIFGSIAPIYNTFFFEITLDNTFKIRDRMDRFILDINYQRLRPKINWIDINMPTNENDQTISRRFSNLISVRDVLDFLSSQQEVFNSENIAIKFKQKNSYSRVSADILYYLYHGKASDIQDRDDNFSAISERINRRLGLIENQVYFNRKNQDMEYGRYKKGYFILRLLEKEMINEIQKNENAMEYLESISYISESFGFPLDPFQKKEEQMNYEKKEHEYDIEKIIETKISFLLKLFNNFQKERHRGHHKYISYDKLANLLFEVKDHFFESSNVLSFSLVSDTRLGDSFTEKLSEEYKTMFQMKFSNLSDGEMVYVNTFVQITKAVTSSKQLLLVLDEPDLNLHPEWSRIFIDNLVTLIEKNASGNVQVIMSSHSPFIVTDFPKENVFFVSEEKKSERKIIRKAKKSFAGNLYDVALDSFFLDFPMGEFVKRKLNALKQHTHQEQMEIVDLIDDTMLKNILIDSYELTELEKKDNRHD